MTGSTAQDTEEGRIPVTGEMTIYTAAEQKTQLIGHLEHAPELALDLSGVSEFDGAGLQLLLALRAEAERQGRGFRVVDPSAAVVEVLDLLDVHALFGHPTQATDEARP